MILAGIYSIFLRRRQSLAGACPVAEDNDEGDRGGKKTPEEREQLLKRVQGLLHERSEDVAKVLRTWLSAENDEK